MEIQGTLAVQQGLATGLDTENIIKSLMSIEKKPVDLIRKRQSELQTKISALDNLKNMLSSLKNAANNLDGMNSSLTGDSAEDEMGFSSKVSSSDETILTAEGSSSVSPGNHTIKVERLAKEDRWAHKEGVAASDEAISSSDAVFTFKVGDGDEQSIEIKGGQTTLDDLKKAINDLDVGVYASIINDGSDDTPYRLVLSGEETGQENAISITNNTTLAGFTQADFDNIQPAQDALLNVDGISGITRAENTIDDIFDGISLTLLKTSSDEIKVNVTQDNATIIGKVETLVGQYNGLISYLKGQSSGGVLSGDTLTYSLQTNIQRMIGDQVTLSDGSKVNASDLGIKTGEKGFLTLDKETLAKFLEKNPEKAKAFFMEKSSGSEGLGVKLSRLLKSFQDSTSPIDARKQGIQSLIKSYDKQAEEEEERLTKVEKNLRAQFTALEQAVSSLQSQQNYFLQQIS